VLVHYLEATRSGAQCTMHRHGCVAQALHVIKVTDYFVEQPHKTFAITGGVLLSVKTLTIKLVSKPDHFEPSDESEFLLHSQSILDNLYRLPALNASCNGTSKSISD
jgi:hypothetical protein